MNRQGEEKGGTEEGLYSARRVRVQGHRLQPDGVSHIAAGLAGCSPTAPWFHINSQVATTVNMSPTKKGD